MRQRVLTKVWAGTGKPQAYADSRPNGFITFPRPEGAVTGGADGDGLGLKGGMPGVNTLDLSLLFLSALIMIPRDTSDSLNV